MKFDTEDVLKFVKLSDNAFAPSKATLDAAGFDLYRSIKFKLYNTTFVHSN